MDREPKLTDCEWCGEEKLCSIYQAGTREQETGYVDVVVLCDECVEKDSNNEN